MTYASVARNVGHLLHMLNNGDLTLQSRDPECERAGVQVIENLRTALADLNTYGDPVQRAAADMART